MKTTIELNHSSPFVGCFEIKDKNINTFQDVKNLAVKWWREEQENTLMPWGKLSYQTIKLTWCDKVIGHGQKVKLEESVLTNFVLVKAILKLTKKEKAKEANIDAKERQNKASMTNKCENMHNVIKVRKHQHQKNLERATKKIKRKVKKTGGIYDASVSAAAREQGLTFLKAGFCTLLS